MTDASPLAPQLAESAKQKLDALLSSLSKAEQGFAESIKQIGLETREQMTANLSGAEVSFSGGRFKINVRTGNLRRHTRMEWPLAGNPLAVGVFNNASYARTIEQGISGEERHMALLWGSGGKTRAKAAKKTGRYYRRIPIGGAGGGMGFWTITEDTELRAAPARPFPAATLEQMQPRINMLLERAFALVLSGGSK